MIRGLLLALAFVTPAAAQAPYVGKWAPDLMWCEQEAGARPITIREGELQGPGNDCKFARVERIPGGYEITAICQGKGGEQEQVFRVLPKSPSRMTFISEGDSKLHLQRCPDY